MFVFKVILVNGSNSIRFYHLLPLLDGEFKMCGEKEFLIHRWPPQTMTGSLNDSVASF
jgi:hypothetical protein